MSNGEFNGFAEEGGSTTEQLCGILGACAIQRWCKEFWIVTADSKQNSWQQIVVVICRDGDGVVMGSTG